MNIIDIIKYPIVRQYDQVDCAPAVLLSVLKYYGGDSSLVSIREMTNTNVNGSTMLDIVNAAVSLGFEAYGASGEYEDLAKEKMPCIAHMIVDNQLQHFVVIYKIHQNEVLIGDPARGLYRLARDKFLDLWKSKTVVLLKPSKELTTQKTPTWFQWITGYLKKEINWIYQSIFLGIAYTIIGLLSSVFIQKLIDQYIPNRYTDKIIYTGIFLLILVLVRVIAGYFRERFLVILNKKINLHINADFLEHLFQLPKKFFDSRKTGDITSRINDAMKIQQAVLHVTGTTLIDGLIIIASIVFIFFFSKVIGLLTLVIVPIYFLLLGLSIKNIKNKQYEVMKGYASVESTYIDSIGGIDEILNHSSSKEFSFLNISFFKHFQDKVEKLGLTQAKLNLFAEILSSCIVIGALIYGAYLVVHNRLLLGEMMACYSLLAGIIPSINRLVFANVILQGASIASTRLMDLFFVDKEKKEGAKNFGLINELKITDGTFSWNHDSNLFENINLSIPKGRITALWGPSGSGKSTIVNVLLRKYNLKNGDVFVGAMKSSEFNIESYRKKIGVLPQQIKVFNATLLENLLLGRSMTNIGDVERRITELGMDFFLKRFDIGLFTRLGEDGRHLSGGELQILALLRALYCNPDVLIIDEGLSGIDIDLEKVIYYVLKKFAENKALFLITHNVSNLLKADYIYLLVNGKIIQEGSPLRLLDKEGLFKNLVSSRIISNSGNLSYV